MGNPRRHHDRTHVRRSKTSGGVYTRSNRSVDEQKGNLESLERSVAFFGAVDTRPHLFLLSVTLASVRRFHPQSGYFVLLPETKANWSTLLHTWSAGPVRIMALPAAALQREFLVPPDRGYSSMTFHRHRMPEALGWLGFQYSVNLDPDVLCTRPWDLRLLLRVRLMGGRAVGSNARTAHWLQGAQDASAGGTANGSTARRENVTDSLFRLLGLTSYTLARTQADELGVMTG